MEVLLFTHPAFLGSTSMPLFANMLATGLEKRGVAVKVLSPNPFFWQLPVPANMKKWLGYIDQYLIFPWQARRVARASGKETLLVFADQALGPWIPWLRHRPHVIHCHDFLALKSSLGEYRQTSVSRTGRLYQRYIRRGFTRGSNFICISQKTREDLGRFLDHPESAAISVVHNGLNYPFSPMPRKEALDQLQSIASLDLSRGFVLHVGGNQWYKNRGGVLAIYAEYASRTVDPLPLLMLGAPPTDALIRLRTRIPAPGCVTFLVRPPVATLHAAYAAASALLYPSIAEGFGWPIAEAMACGCTVLTTGVAPMTEVGGTAAIYLPEPSAMSSGEWAIKCAEMLGTTLSRSASELEAIRVAGLAQAASFSEDKAISSYIEIYAGILNAGAA